jgi:hypothetical protein
MSKESLYRLLWAIAYYHETLGNTKVAALPEPISAESTLRQAKDHCD